MAKPDFAAGLTKLKASQAPAPEQTTFLEPIPSDQSKAPVAPSREGKVAISGYFDPAVRAQLQILAIRQDTTMVAMMAEAINLLFEKYGESPIARG